MSEYNGWKNRETWCVNHHLGNDYGAYLHCTHLAEHAEGADRRKKVAHLAREIQGFVLESYSEVLSRGDMASEMFGNCLVRVDWAAIAEGFLEGVE